MSNLSDIISEIKYLEDLQKLKSLVASGNIKPEALEIFKARSGVYADTSENRRLKRVGQKYGSGGQVDASSPKVKTKDGKNGGGKDSGGSIEDYAKQTSEEALQQAVKKSPDPEVRQAAHQELERRKKEEHIKEEKEEGGKGKKGEESKAPSNKSRDHNDLEKEIDGLEKEIQQRRKKDIDYSDLNSVIEESNKIQELIDKRKQLIEEQNNLRKVSFEEYRKGFKTFDSSAEEDNELYNFYNKGSERVEEYLNKKDNSNNDQKISLNTYTGNGYKAVRSYLTSPDKYDRKSVGSSMESEVVKKVSEDLSVFIENNKITENLSLHRRVKGGAIDFFKSLNKGGVYEDKSFSSTSLKELSHFGDFNIEILAKKGSSVANAGNEGELEYIIDKGSKFRVLDKSDSGIIVELL